MRMLLSDRRQFVVMGLHTIPARMQIYHANQAEMYREGVDTETKGPT